ncbi:MAG: FG-GAP repeat domain-containing protein [Oscillospiraceae bacterium]
MKKKIRLLAAAVSAAALLVLTGCMSTPADELYALPQLSEGYLQLQSVINQVLNSGAEYAAPASGSHRQAIQLEDVDGDGIKEAVAFFNFLGSDKPIKIYIFRKNAEGEYEEAARIEGEGTGIDSISYTDMDGDGVKEIAVGWQIVSGMNMLSVYSMKGYQVNQLINTDYTEYVVCDMNTTLGNDIVVLRVSSSELTGEAKLYSLTADGEMVNYSARLTNGIEAMLRVRTTSLSDGNNAVLVESSLNGGGIVTDILTAKKDKLVNITLDATSGVSEDTIRLYEVYCRDINGDGIIDVPKPVVLPSTSENTTYYMLEWHSYSSSGNAKRIFSTYNNYTDSWYLVLPDSWCGNITVRRVDGASGERAVVFSKVLEDGETLEDFLAIYTLTGENRAERASYGARFVLLAEEETIYAAEILTKDERFDLPVSQEIVRSNFRILYSEWITGET